MDILKAIFLLFLAGLIAFTFNYFHWRIQESKKAILSAALTLRDCLEKLEDYSLSYWAKNYPEHSESSTHKKILEIKIKGMLKLTRRMTSQLLGMEVKSISASERYKINDFPSNIFDLITGDDFEAEEIDQNFVKCAKISNLINDVKLLVIKIENNNRY